MNKKLIILQGIILAIIVIAIYLLYPKVTLNISGNSIKFYSESDAMITLSENPDFSDSRYIELKKNRNFSISLAPGTYFWRADNNLISSLKNKLTIPSEVELDINESEDLVNIGNVKVNITKNKDGGMTGYITLEPGDSEQAENDTLYTGGQA